MSPTHRSFEAEMFERANRKLGLEHAVLGGHNFKDEEDADPNKISNKEMEQLLRQVRARQGRSDSTREAEDDDGESLGSRSSTANAVDE